MKQFLYCLMLLCSVYGTAQEIQLSGVVKDSTGIALEMANVIAYNQSNGMAGYSITNQSGEYRISVPKDSIYTLRVSYIGLVTPDYTTTDTTQDVNHDFVMFEDSNALDAIELTYEMPVEIKGDTIIYNADSFNDGSERNLGDVMENLPGVEINDDGEIEVEGKVVQNVMVEGREFFDGDSKLATENIPASAVDKVQVLRNYNEVGQLRGLGNADDQIAINIKLKEGKDSFWFGEIMAGGGLDERYHVKPKLFYYSPDFSVNILTDMNNIGEEAFSRRDYWRFTGGLGGRTRQSGTSFQTGGGDIGFLATQNNRANEIESKFGAMSFSWKASESFDLTGFAIGSDTKTDLKTITTREYIENGVNENLVETADQRAQLGLFKVSGKYVPNVNLFVEFDAFAKASDQSENSFLLSQRNAVLEPITEFKEQKPISFQQNTNAYYTLNEDNIFALELQYLYQNEDPFYEAIRSVQPFSGTLPIDGTQSQFDINQDKQVQTNRLDAKVDYWHVLGKKSNLNFTIGGVFSKQNFDSNIFQILDNGTQFDIAGAPFGNDVGYNFNDTFVGVHYKFVSGIFTVSPGLTLHKYDVKDEQLGVVNDRDFTALLPDLFVRAEFGSTENLTLNYNRTTEFTDVERLAQGFVFNNYNRLYRGDNQLENANYDNFNLAYFNFSMFNFTNIFAFVNYSIRNDALKNRTVLAGINQVNEPINSRLADETLTAAGSYEKTFRRWKAGLRANYNYSQFNNVVNNREQESNSFTQNYRLSIGTNFRKAPNVDFGYNLTLNDYDQGGVKTKFTTHRPSIEFNWQFSKGFLFTSDYSYFNYSDDANTIENDYQFLDAALFYQYPESKWEFKLSVTNLLDNDSINRNNSNQFFVQSSEYFVQPRYTLLSVRYDLR